MKEITPKGMRCEWGECPSLHEVTPADMRCGGSLSSCPALYEITPTEAKCRPFNCLALYEQEDGVLVIGKIVPIPEELKSKVGPDETLVWVPKGLLKDIEWG